jgi:hypothetical protein
MLKALFSCSLTASMLSGVEAAMVGAEHKEEFYGEQIIQRRGRCGGVLPVYSTNLPDVWHVSVRA